MKLKRSALDPTAAERNHVAEATSRRRRILRSRILFYVWPENFHINFKNKNICSLHLAASPMLCYHR